MSLIVQSAKRNRVYVRRFDHEEAARRHAAGETLTALAAEYGVTFGAVQQAVSPARKERAVEAKRRWRTGACEVCGEPAMKLVSGKKEHNPDGRVLCNTCRGIKKRTGVRFDDDWTLVAIRCNNADCASGDRWQPPENFGRGKRYPDLREGGFHGSCRRCLTRHRQDYRERHKVPCETCGTSCLPPSEKGARGFDKPRCRDCFLAARRKPEAVTSEAASPLKEKASSDA